MELMEEYKPPAALRPAITFPGNFPRSMAGTAVKLTAATAHPAQPAHAGRTRLAGQDRVARGQEQRGDQERDGAERDQDASASALITTGPGLLKVSSAAPTASAAPPSVTEATTGPAAEDQG